MLFALGRNPVFDALNVPATARPGVVTFVLAMVVLAATTEWGLVAVPVGILVSDLVVGAAALM